MQLFYNKYMEPSRLEATPPSPQYERIAELFRRFYKEAPIQFTVSGAENLPNEGRRIIAATHHNSWDVVAVGCGAYYELGQPVHFLAYEDFLDGTNKYNLPIPQNTASRVAKLLRDAHALPVGRNGMTRDQLRVALSTVYGGNVLGIFAEGKRTNSEEVAEIKSGAAYLAAKTGAAVVCAAVFGRIFGEVGSKRAYLPRSLHAHFSDPIYAGGSTREDIQALNVRIEAGLQSAWEEAQIQYDINHPGIKARILNRLSMAR